MVKVSANNSTQKLSQTSLFLYNPQIRSPTHTLSSMASATCSSSPISLSNPPSSHSHPSLTSSILNLRFSSSSHFTSPSSLSLTLVHHIKPTFITSAPKCTINASTTTNKKKVLIVNTNSGGHAVIGFYFAKDLLSSGHDVTVLTVGDESSDKMKKPPFTRFHELVAAGGSTVWGSPNDVRTAVGGHQFDVVLDNNGKDLDTVKPVADWAKSSGAEQFLYISSAGIYKPTDEVPHVEGDAVKAEASHVPVEKYILDLSFSSCAIFRPQYMIGSGNNKDCEEWFFDRIVRDREVPIPGSGMQLTNISHVRDLSSMLSQAVGNPAAAAGKIFNCVSDRAVTLDGFARLCAKAAGKEVKIIHYDPKAVGVEAKKAFPFRTMHFYAEPRAAKQILGWTSSTDLAVDLVERFEEYLEIGRGKKDMKFDIDDKILEATKTVQVTV